MPHPEDPMLVVQLEDDSEPLPPIVVNDVERNIAYSDMERVREMRRRRVSGKKKDTNKKENKKEKRTQAQKTQKTGSR